MTARNSHPLVQLADEASHVAQRCTLYELASDPFKLDAFTHVKMAIGWLNHVAQGHVGIGIGMRLAWLEATIAHRLNPVRYWPLLCVIGQHQFDDSDVDDAAEEVDKLEGRVHRANL